MTNGIAQYWDAKYIQAFSKSNLTLAQHIYTLDEFRWITSKSFFKSNYDFAIASERYQLPHQIHENSLIEINGIPKKIISCGSFSLMIYGKNMLNVRNLLRIGKSYEWQGCKLPTVIGKYSSNCEIESAANIDAGYISYGPYQALPAGKYFFEFKYVSSKPKTELAGDWDVVIALPNEAKPLTNGVFAGTENKEGKFTGFFTLESAYDMDKVEVRNIARSGGSMKINYLKITRLE